MTIYLIITARRSLYFSEIFNLLECIFNFSFDI